jgi:hypothetical protein
MAAAFTFVAPITESEPSWVDAEVEVSLATYQAYQVLYYGFIVLMAVAGLDKFLHILATWDSYVSPAMASFLHLSPGAITVFAGLIELGGAAAVALKPRIGSWVVTAWLWLVVVNLLCMPGHYDLVLQDLALSAAGFAFTRLAAECN